MDFNSTVKGSLLEGFYPKGWDMEKIDKCCDMGVKREDFWHKDFNPIECETLGEFDTLMGHEIALQIKKAKDNGTKIALIVVAYMFTFFIILSCFLLHKRKYIAAQFLHIFLLLAVIRRRIVTA